MTCTCHRVIGHGCNPETGDSGPIYATETDCPVHGTTGTPDLWSVIAEAAIKRAESQPHRCQVQLRAPRPRNEGDRWTCDECGTSWTLKRAAEVDPAIRLHPIRRWVKDLEVQS